MPHSHLEKLFREDPMLEKAALVAELYYVYQLPQKKIAQQLGISRPWVSKLLKRAEESGIVTIQVETAWAGVPAYEKELTKRFTLQGVKVVESAANNWYSLNYAARAASHYLASILQPGDVVGFSWGYSLYALAEEFASVSLPDITLVPLVGGMGANTRILSNHIVETIGKKTGASYRLLHLPAFVAGKSQKQSLLADENIAEIITLGEKADIMMCSIGDLTSATMVRDGYISPEEIHQLQELGAVGDIGLKYINAQGELLSHPIDDRRMAGDFKRTRDHVRTNMALAVGKEKVPVIHAALTGNLIDLLITDTHTAKGVLELEEKRERTSIP